MIKTHNYQLEENIIHELFRKSVHSFNKKNIRCHTKKSNKENKIKYTYVTQVYNLRMDSPLFGNKKNTVLIHIENHPVEVTDEDGFIHIENKPVFHIEFLYTE